MLKNKYTILFACYFGVVGLMYSVWCHHRVSKATLTTDAANWPRSWPYPDQFLAQCERALDKLFPSPKGALKFHGEFERLRGCIVLMMMLFFILTFGFGYISFLNIYVQNKKVQLP